MQRLVLKDLQAILSYLFKHRRDVTLVAPTGGGKSYGFQSLKFADSKEMVLVIVHLN